MAPEHLEALRRRTRHGDPRSDIYSVGVVLHELFTGRLPFSASRTHDDALAEMIADRRRRLPRFRKEDRIPAAVESILARCLDGDVSKRYQSVAELREDLTRQLESRPLKYAAERSWKERCQKWRRRHRQLTSMAAVVSVSLCIMGLLAAGLIARESRLKRVAAEDSLQEFLAEAKAVRFELNQPNGNARQIDAGLAHCRETLARYDLLEQDRWQAASDVQLLSAADQQRIRDTAVDLLLVWARTLLQRSIAAPNEPDSQSDLAFASRLNGLARAWFTDQPCPRAVLLQAADIAERMGDSSDRVSALRDDARRLPLNGPADLVLEGNDLIGKGDFQKAGDLLEQATMADPQHVLAWLALGHCRFRRGDFVRAAACYGTCVALSPEAHWAWFDLGLAHLEAHEYKSAKFDFGRAIALNETHGEAWVNRGLAELKISEADAASTDFTHALELQTPDTRIYFLRSKARELVGDTIGAAADRETGLQQQPTDETSWVARGVAKLAGDPQGALGDFEQALKLNPQSAAALQDKAHVLAELLGRPTEAAAALDQFIELYPDNGAGYASRGVLLARLGRHDAARRDAREALLRDTNPPTVYRAACIYALTSAENHDDQREALRLLSTALRDGFGLDIVNVDPDLKPLREHSDFQKVVQAAQTLTSRSAAP